MKRSEPVANFAQHPKGQCSFCDAGAKVLCAAFNLFLYSGGDEGEWKALRGFMVPGTGRLMNRTVWQLVCAAEGIKELSGGKYCDGGEVPTPAAVMFALATGNLVEASR